MNAARRESGELRVSHAEPIGHRGEAKAAIPGLAAQRRSHQPQTVPRHNPKRTRSCAGRMVKKIDRVGKARLAASTSLFGLPLCRLDKAYNPAFH